MIKRINKIKNFCVFQNYKRDGNLLDFREKNIIYGWNYSGKTTLSRLMSYLDKSTTIDTDYQDVEFEVELDDAGHTKINETNRSISPVLIKVFNSDFVRENLHFDTDEKLTGIKFAVGEVGKIQKQIDDIEQYIKKANDKIEKNQKYIAEFNNFENGFTTKARDITNLLNLGRSFDKSSIKTYIQQWTDGNYEQYLITDDELDAVRTKATSANTGVTISTTLKPVIQFDNIIQQVDQILSSTPLQNQDNEILSQDKELYDWVKAGVDIYNKRETPIQKCAFCGSDISDGNTLSKLNAFYSNEAAKVKSAINTVKEFIVQEQDKIRTLDWSTKSENDVAQSCKQKFQDLKNQYDSISYNYIELLSSFSSKLDKKYSNSLFVAMELGAIDDSAKSAIEQWIDNVKSVFDESNSIIDNFDTVQKEAKEKYKKHLVAQHLIDIQYTEVARKKLIEECGIAKFKHAIELKTKEKEELNSKLNSIEKGKQELEDYIKLFLNRDDLKIEPTSDNYFVLKRGNKKARNLSEGEKTAIAFSHFMVSLKSLKDEGKLNNYVVFIDDPISSLDANHIAQVSSLINSFFFQSGLDPTDPNKVCNCFHQLFISTHNFEFFSFLKDANNIKRKDKETCSYYMIRKESVEKSTIINIPKPFSKYKSEYVYLFYEIDRFKNDNLPEERIYMMPNIIRRFLEIYTLMKLPGNVNEIDNRLKILFDGKIELKILHTFSHFTSFERATKHNELVLKMPDIINDLYAILNNDPDHLKSLQEGIKE